MNTRTLLTAFLLACAGAWSSLGDARVEVGEMAVKTYPFGAPDPVPATATTRYPYFRYDGSSVDGAGNPVIPGKTMTSYLWEEVFTKSSLSNIIENFAQVIVTEDKKTHKPKEKVIWPQYH